MNKARAEQFRFGSKTLSVFCAVLHEGDVPDAVLHSVKDAFESIALFVRHENQTLYIRDLPALAIQGRYPGGHCYNSYEAMIALASWRTNARQIKASINHELHHMARWQQAGYGETLGGAILSEGLATYYEALRSGWRSPWAMAEVGGAALQAAFTHWDDAGYDHNAWFFDGPYGEWTGYGIGYGIAKLLFRDGFDLGRSITIQPDEALAHAKQILV